MEKYIIKYDSKVNGINIKLYHESININQHEAIKVSTLFAYEHQIPTIIKH
jgi:hypothetical protein